MSLKFFEKLSNNYLELIDDKEDFNVIINVGELSNTKIFRAHSAILKHRSLYFRNKLANIKSNENNIKTINLKHVTVEQFEIIIKYIYGGIVSLENLDTSLILELMIITCEFFFEELAKSLETYLIETKTSWLRLNFSDVYQKSFQNNKFQRLQNWCNNIIVKHPNRIFESEYFTSIQENALISLIKRDDLQMDEIKILEHIIEWGIAQNPVEIPSNPKSWSNENFSTMKTTLQNLLPLIRYFQMSSDDIINYLQPYQQLLDNNLWNDIIKRSSYPNRSISSIILPPRVVLKQTLPPRTTTSFSTIINEAHVAKITSWIDDDEYSITNNSYEFKLLLRGSRDGFTPA
ncbi:hypothetical protein C2G38_2045493 [Gigaspora rosea]|uniref:BTB domain-containing protein n=1 Tax=Gigaspora rosea TaxID=44941 RepID=A0A397UGX5_9GLOM|nr:hypothetical protein C2G38_2045493 [Gigaspora rosea]